MEMKKQLTHVAGEAATQTDSNPSPLPAREIARRQAGAAALAPVAEDNLDDAIRRVEKLAALGLSNREISQAMRWPAGRLRRRAIHAAIAAGRSQLVLRLRARQLQTAMDGNISMIKEMGRQHLHPDMAETSDAPPVKTLVNVDLDKV